MKFDLCHALHDYIYMKHPEKANLEKQKNRQIVFFRDGLGMDCIQIRGIFWK